MIKLIVGLGNPGRQYEANRHNVGFIFLNHLLEASDNPAQWLVESKFRGIIAKSTLAEKKVMLLKPQTFMNRSGEAVGLLAKFYKVSAEEVLVVHDELDLSVGALKLKFGGGHAGHNGIRDIISVLGGDFYRIRIGIGRPEMGGEIANYVLSNPSKKDLPYIKDSFSLIEGQMGNIIAGNMSQAMNVINS